MALRSDIRRMLAYCRPARRIYLSGTIALCIVDLLDVSAPLLILMGMHAATRNFSDASAEPSVLERMLPESWFSAASGWHGMWVYALAYVSVVLITGFFRYWMASCFPRATIGISNDLRNRFYAHVQRLDAAWHDRATTGKIMSLATNDLDACRFFWGYGILMSFDCILYLIITPIYMFSISWELTLMCMVPLPILPFAIRAIAIRFEKRFEVVQEQFSVLSNHAHESFAGAKVVKSFAAEEQEVSRYAAMAREYKRRALAFARIATMENPAIELFMGLTNLVVVAFGGWLVLEGRLGVEAFVAFFFFLLRLSAPMLEAGYVIALFQRANVSLRRIEEVLHTPVTIVDAPNARVPEVERGRIEFRNLSYTYPQSQLPSLRGVSLTVEAGSTVALVGEVGSGKSTMLALLTRLYDPPAGTVFIDDIDVRELQLQWLRRRVAMVPQETFLFSDTILANIGYGSGAQGKSPEQLRSFARIACVEDDILGFPKGYDTMLGERGVNLSGGQKQRVAIARAIACDPLVLLLDDCLSAVDAATEERIQAQLRTVMAARTSLIVSHRISSVMHADRIVVLQRGEIVESGTHRELLAHQGWYADLYKKQQIEAASSSGRFASV